MISQVAVSLVLVIGALLFVRSFRNLLTTDAGFRQDGLHYVFCFLPRPNLSPEQHHPGQGGAARPHPRVAAD